MNLESMISQVTDDASTGEATITLTERGRAVFADLLGMVRIPEPADPLERIEGGNVRTLLEELERIA